MFLKKKNLFIICFLSSGFCLPANAGEVNISGFGITSYDKTIKSYKESLFEGIVKQKYDFSCGSAALATLLYYHYYYNVTEIEILRAMYEVGDKETILKKGFSLLDMKSYLASVGLSSDGYKMSIDKLRKIGLPSVVLINNGGYLHFVVIKGIYGDEILLGDPSLGVKKMAISKFKKMWNGVSFFIKNDTAFAKQSFNLISEWNVRGKVRFGDILLDADLADVTADFANTTNYYTY